LARLDNAHRIADFLDDPDVLMTHRSRAIRLSDAPVGPQVRSADAGRRDANDRVRWLDDLRTLALFDPDVSGAVHDHTTHEALNESAVYLGAVSAAPPHRTGRDGRAQ